MAGRSPNLAWAIPSKATGSASGGGDGLAPTISPSAALAAPTSANFGGTSVIGSSVGVDVPAPGLSEDVHAAMAALVEMAKTTVAADVSASAPGQPCTDGGWARPVPKRQQRRRRRQKAHRGRNGYVEQHGCSW